ncbi:MAG: F0F1 ATP synthase subunit A, partial [Betaproteobacteria bacterium]
MADEQAPDATSYIQHHLTFLAEPVRESGGFWTIHYDTIITSLILGVVV